MSACLKCGKKVMRGDGIAGLKCGTCAGLFHAECEWMSKQDLQSFLSLSPAQRGAWNCKDCEERRKTILRSESADPSLQFIGRRFDGIEERFDSVECKMNSLGRIEDLISKMFDQFSDLKNDVSGLRQEVVQIRDDLDDLHDENIDIKRKIELVERNSAKNSMEPPCDFRAIEIHGVPQSIGKDTFIAAENILKETLNLNIEERDLDDCFYIGGRTNGVNMENEKDAQSTNNGGNGSRQSISTGILVIRFTTRRLRDMIFKSWRECVVAGRTFVVNGVPIERLKMTERLNRPTRELLRATRRAAGESGWRHVWTRGGRILVRRENSGRVFNIYSTEDFEIFKK